MKKEDVSSLPNYQAPYKNWLFALDSRLKFSEEAIKQNDINKKKDAADCLLNYIKESPQNCDDLDIIAANQIEIINLSNIATQLAEMQKNSNEYLKIVEWVNRKFPKGA